MIVYVRLCMHAVVYLCVYNDAKYSLLTNTAQFCGGGVDRPFLCLDVMSREIKHDRPQHRRLQQT